MEKFDHSIEIIKQSILVSIYYEWTLFNLVFNHLPLEKIDSKVFDKWASVTLYHYALTFRLWNLSHYRAPTYQDDLLANLKNVALPGTGIALSWFCYNYYIGLVFVFVGIPVYCFISAVYTILLSDVRATKEFHLLIYLRSVNVMEIINKILNCYIEYLLHPKDWFSLWRLNCSIVALHSHATKSISYELENKWKFLQEGHKLGVPVTPYLTDLSHLVCKHKNIEGI